MDANPSLESDEELPVLLSVESSEDEDAEYFSSSSGEDGGEHPDDQSPPLEDHDGNESSEEGDGGSLPSLWTVSSSSDDDDGNIESHTTPLRVPPPIFNPQNQRSTIDVGELFRTLLSEEPDVPDSSRADILLGGLEPIPRDLVTRYERLTGGDEPHESVTCAVCRESLLSTHGDLPIPAAEETTFTYLSHLPFHLTTEEVFAMPCMHLFHWYCLSPWLAIKTTCPTCRFDIDPRSLTHKSNPSSIRERWQIQPGISLTTWLDEEEAIQAGHMERSKRQQIVQADFDQNEIGVSRQNLILPNLTQADYDMLRAQLRGLTETQFAELLQEGDDDDESSDSSSMPDLEAVNPPPQRRQVPDYGAIMREQVEMFAELMRMSLNGS